MPPTQEQTNSLRVLVVEDESKLAQAIAESLEAAAWQVTLSGSGEEGFFLASNESFDVAILDINLPGRDGLEILRTLRHRGWQTQIGRAHV